MDLKIKAGPLTLAFGLVAAGLGMLAYNFGLFASPKSLWKYWPLLLIGLGVEYFVRRAVNKEREVTFHVPSILLTSLIIVAGLVVNSFPDAGLNRILEETVLNGRFSYTRQWQSDPVPLSSGAKLVIENRNGAVRLKPSEDGNLRVRAEIIAYGPSEGKARIEAENREIVVEKGPVTKIYPKSGSASLSFPDTDNLTVEVPPGVNIEVDAINGKVGAEDLAGSLNIRAANGEVDVRRLEGSLQLRGGNGRVTAVDINGNASINTTNGRIRLENLKGDVSAETSNAGIEFFSDAPLDKTVVLRSISGSLNFSLPKESSLEIEARTSHGRITGLEDSTYSSPGVQNRIEKFKLGEGTGSAKLSTENGSIHFSIN